MKSAYFHRPPKADTQKKNRKGKLQTLNVWKHGVFLDAIKSGFSVESHKVSQVGQVEILANLTTNFCVVIPVCPFVLANLIAENQAAPISVVPFFLGRAWLWLSDPIGPVRLRGWITVGWNVLCRGLVGGWTTHLKNMLVKWEIFPKIWVKIIIPARDPKQCFNKNMQNMHSVWALYVWALCVSTVYEHYVWALYVWALYAWALYVWALYVWALYVSTMCEHCERDVGARCVNTLCEHSMCEHSMCSTMCEHSMFEHSMCEHCVWAPSVWALYVWALYVWALFVWALFVWALYVSTMCEHHVWALCVTTMCEHSMCEPSMCEHSMCALYVWALYVKTMCEHHVWALWAHKEEVLGPSSWICHCDLRSWRAGKYENHHQKWTSKNLKSQKLRELPRKMNIEEVEAPKHQKSTSFIMKTPLRTIPEQRKARELPRKMNIEEVEEPKKYENYHAKLISDPFKSIAEHRKVR